MVLEQSGPTPLGACSEAGPVPAGIGNTGRSRCTSSLVAQGQDCHRLTVIWGAPSRDAGPDGCEAGHRYCHRPVDALSHRESFSRFVGKGRRICDTGAMKGHVIIDGNNLLHSMHAHAPLPAIGRETMVKVVERWAADLDDDVTLVFDGPVPREGLARQMTSRRITVRFSAPVTADDVIVSMIHRARNPETVRVVSSDSAIRHEAIFRRCRHIDAVDFVAELFTSDKETAAPARSGGEKPDPPTPEQTDEWIEVFDLADDEPTDGVAAKQEENQGWIDLFDACEDDSSGEEPATLG